MQSLYRVEQPLTPDEEREFAARAKGGDRDAEERMIAAVAPLIHSLARRAGPCDARFDDAVQDATIAVWRAIERFDPAKGGWCGWAGRHARFAVLHSLTDGAAGGVPLVEVPAPEVDADEAAAREQSAAAIRAGLRALLGPDDAEVVACKVLEDLTETQTARRLHRSWRTVRASEQRGMARLREVVRARA